MLQVPLTWRGILNKGKKEMYPREKLTSGKVVMKELLGIRQAVTNRQVVNGTT